MKPRVEIDSGSGFCFGVVTAIRKAEEELDKSGRLYCLGDIVHNSAEVERLRQRGLITITHEQLADLHDVKVLLRAHGEPPTTYETARRNRIDIIDATCPVVLQLQKRIKATHADSASSTPPQIVIYGKVGHAEVNGLVGQTAGRAIVVESADDLDRLDYTTDIYLYSQTTKSLEGFRHMRDEIERRLVGGAQLHSFDTICRQVANRVDRLRKFASEHTVILFVSGSKSSNGRILHNECLNVNPRTHLIANASEIDSAWFANAASVGICGATSTPRWLMEDVAQRTIELTREQ